MKTKQIQENENADGKRKPEIKTTIITRKITNGEKGKRESINANKPKTQRRN